MPASANQKGIDWSNMHAINMARVEAGEAANVVQLLTELDATLSGLLVSSNLGPGKAKQLATLQAAAQQAIGKTYKDISGYMDGTLQGVAKMEATATGKMMNSQVGADVFGAVLTENQWSKVANKTLIFGHSSAKWWESQDQSLRFKFAQQMQEGYALGESIEELTRRVRGTKANGYKDGIMATSKREAEALVRSSIQTISNAARIASFEQNQDVMKGIQWVATLDTRTTEICMALNGKQWRFPDYEPVGHDKKFPGPVAHWGCRSSQNGVMRSWAELSGKPLKALDQATLQEKLQAKLAAKGMSPEQVAMATAKTQASMDGQVPQVGEHGDWLSSLSDNRAKAILGPGRYNLWKAGTIKVTDLTDQNNRPLTLAQLEAAYGKDVLPQETEGVDFLPLSQAPEKFKKAVDQAVAAELAKQANEANAAATEQMKAILANPEGQQLKAKAVKSVQKDHPEWSPTEQLDAALAQAAEKQAAASKAAALSQAKKNILAGKQPTPAQQAYIDGLGPEELAYWQNSVMDAKGLQAADLAKQEAEAALAAKVQAEQSEAMNKIGGWIAKGDPEQLASFNEAKAELGPDSDPVELMKLTESIHEDKLAAAAEKAAMANVKAQSEAFDKLMAIQAGETTKLKQAALAKIGDVGTLPNDSFVETLAKVEAEAAEKQAAASKASKLSTAKKKILEGKAPSPSEQLTIDALTPEEKANFDASVKDAKTVATADDSGKLTQVNQDPVAELKAVFTAADQGTKAKILEAIGGDSEGFLEHGGAISDAQWIDDTIELITEIEEDMGGSFNAAASLKAAQDVVKAQLAATPTPAKVTKTTVAPDIEAKNLDLYVPDPATLVKVKDLPGSTRPYLAKDPTTGKEWVVKSTESGIKPDHLRSEALADAIYRAAGAPVPGSAIAGTKAKPVKVAEYLDGGQTYGTWKAKATPAQQEAMRQQLADRFVLDALLANWDVAGLGNDNILIVGDKAIRIDNGGSLFFRAQGAKKAFGPEVLELKSLRDPSQNANTAAIFGGLTDDDINRQIVEVLAKREAILEAAAADPTVRKALEARLDWLESQLPKAAVPDKTAARQDWEQLPQDTAKRVTAARINGTSVPVGTTHVEDMQALTWQEKKGGQDTTVVHLKITDQGEAAIKAAIKADLDKATKATSTTTSGGLEDPWKAKWEAMAKTLAVHATDKAYNQGTVANFETAYAQAKATWAQLGATKNKTALQKAEFDQVAHYLKIGADLQAAKTKGTAVPWVQAFAYDANAYQDDKAPKAKPKPQAAFTVTRSDYYEPRKTTLQNGFATDLGQAVTKVPVDAGVYKLSYPDGTEVVYIPRTGRRATVSSTIPGVALEGTVEVRLPATADRDTVAKALQKLRDMGIDTTAADADYREAVWLHKTVTVHHDQGQAGWQKILALPTVEEQIVEGRKWIEKRYKVTVPKRGEPGYTADGEANVFGDGYRHTYRADLTKAEAAKQMKGYVLQHTSGRDLADVIDGFLNSGGEVTTTTGRLRKGIDIAAGMSASTDLQTGGASFFFTRIRKLEDATKNGLLFKAENLARADAVTYTGDKFGATGAVAQRKSTVAEYKDIASKTSSDETIFKNGLFFLTDIELVRVGNAEYRNRILAVFKKHGITKLPDGRKVEDVVVVA